MTREEQAAVDYTADVISGASALQVAKSLETAEFYFRDVPDCDRRKAIFDSAVKAVANDLKNNSEKLDALTYPIT
jgi:hypothetical protein